MGPTVHITLRQARTRARQAELSTVVSVSSLGAGVRREVTVTPTIKWTMLLGMPTIVVLLIVRVLTH